MPQNLLPEVILDRPLRRLPNLLTSIFPTAFPNLFEENLFSIPEDIAARSARIYEENNHLHVEVPLPGLQSNDIEVTLNKGVLIVKGESKEEEQNKKRKFYRASSRRYAYSIVLPAQIDEKQEPEAVFENGILNISMKLPKQGERKKIAVRSKSSQLKK